MLPTAIDVMVVILVQSAYLYGQILPGIVIDGTALVHGTKMFVQDRGKEGIARKVDLQTYQIILPPILPKHLALVLKEVLQIGGSAPSVALPVGLKMPRAQLIALRIGKVSIIHITSPRDNGMPNAAEAIEELTMGG